MRAFDRDLIRGGHYGQRLVCRANRPNTWLHRPACKHEENPCQLGAVHTWHIADMPTSLLMSASLIGHSGSSAFRLSTTTVSMSLTGSCFSSESAPGALPSWDSRRGGTIFRATLPSM